MARPLILPCCEKSLCLDPGTPILNLSAELDDGPSYIGVNYDGQTPRVVGGNDPGVNPPPPGFCISQDSQIVADQCAERDQVNNDDPGGQNPQPVRFGNAAQSCTSICPDGLPFTYVVAAGTYLGFSQVLVDRAALSFACNLARQNRICLSDLQDFGCVSEAYSDTLIPLGTGPFTFAIVSGALPPGLALTQNGSIGTISGTPAVAGNFTFTVRVTSANGNFMQRTYSIAVLEILNSSNLPNFTIGVPYSVQLNAVGGTGPYSFAVTDGLFPDGISMSDAGLISGTPTEGGDFPVTIAVTDADNVECSKDFNLHGALLAPNYSICDWTNVLAQLGSFAACNASIQPAWNGVFDQQSTCSTSPGSVIWYFIDKSINGTAVAASQAPNYPAGNWQCLDCFTQLFYNAASGVWSLFIICAGDCTALDVWVGSKAANFDPNDASGVYVQSGGTAANPPSIQITKANSTSAPNWNNLNWYFRDVNPSGTGTAAFIPLTVPTPSASFDAQAQDPNASPSGYAQAFADLWYAGPAVTGKLSITLTKSGPVNNVAGGVTVQVGAGLALVFDNASNAAGVYELPFAIGDTGGVCTLIHIEVTAQVRQFAFDFGAAAVHIVGTFSNV